MIYLKEQEDEIDILINGMSVFVLGSKVIAYKESQRWNNVVLSLQSSYGDKYKKEIKLLCTLSAAALRHNLKGSQISLDKNNYIAANKLTNQGVSYQRMKELLTQLDEDRMIDLYVGFKNKIEGMPSFFIILPPFMSLWEGIDVSKAPAIEYDTIVVRDTESKECLDTRSFKGIVVLRQALDRFNSMLKNCEVMIEGKKVDVLSYKRVFHDNLNTSGRYYSNNSFQTIPKAFRQTITIDGNNTVELDYTAMHPRILYCLEGIALDREFSPYIVAGYDRNITKFAMLAMLYNTNKLSAKRTIKNHTRLSWEDVETIIERIENNNIPILKYFYNKGMWGVLQYKDSLIASHVISACAERNIVVLPYHDSFRVIEGHEEILKGIMFEAWNKVLGTTNNCVVVCK